MVKGLINGLHHVTSLSGSARNNARFYTEILGLQFVKKTVNFDSPDTWHLFYGDKKGSPGSLVSYFPFSGITRGKAGNKSVSSIMFSIGENSMDFWLKRLKTHQIDFRGPITRFNEEFIFFEDFDGMHIELVANAHDQRSGCYTAGIPVEHGIKGLYSLSLSYASADSSIDFLIRQFDHKIIVQSDERVRLSSGNSLPGSIIDLISRPSVPNQIPGTGTVLHLSFQTTDDTSLDQIRNYLSRLGMQPSPITDRYYYKTISFKEPGGILFEVSTANPGFLFDESPSEIGEYLKLPPWLEEQRDHIEESLSTF